MIANEEQLEILANSIGEIKRISINIGEQVKEDNDLIGSMQVNMVKGKEMMIKTMNKLDKVLNSKSGNIIFYTIVFILIVFMVLYCPHTQVGEWFDEDVSDVNHVLRNSQSPDPNLINYIWNIS